MIITLLYNDLLGERRPITQQQYNDENLTTPQLKHLTSNDRVASRRDRGPYPSFK